jgi:hypothetical protein
LEFFATYLVNGIIENLHHVELVKSQVGLWELLFNAADECRGHVAIHFLNGVRIATMIAYVLFKAFNRGGIFIHNINCTWFRNEAIKNVNIMNLIRRQLIMVLVRVFLIVMVNPFPEVVLQLTLWSFLPIMKSCLCLKI